MGSPSETVVGTACLGVVCPCVSEGLWSACVYMCACLALGHEVPSSPGRTCRSAGSWVVFVCGLTLGGGVPSLRTYPLRSPRKHLCVLFPWGPMRRVCKEAEPSLASLAPAGRGCPWEEFYPVSLSSKLIDSTPCRSRIQGLRGKLAEGERGVSKGHLRRGDHQPSAWFFLFFLISCDGYGGGAPSTGASATFPFPSGDLLGAQPCVPPDVQRQGSCDQPLGLSPLGIPKQWKGLFALVFRGRNPKSPPRHLGEAVGV